MKRPLYFIILFYFQSALLSQAQRGSDINGSNGQYLSNESISMNASGSRIAVGVKQANIVKVFQYSSDGWTQLGSNIGPGSGAAEFGARVSMNSAGDRVAISATNVNDNVYQSYVEVYQYSNSAWSRVGSRITSADNEQGYRVSLSSDGLVFAIGSPYSDGNGTDAGSIKVYAWDSSDWVQRGETNDGEAAGDLYGLSVSLSGDGTVVAGGAISNDGNGTNAGHIRIYKWWGSNWAQYGPDIDGEAASDSLGFSVALSYDGKEIAATTQYNDGNGEDSGHARVFTYGYCNGAFSQWCQRGSDINGEAAGDHFGASVAINSDGTTIAVGAPYNDGNGSNSGHVRVYDWGSSSWSKRGNDIDGEASQDNSGARYSLAMDSAGTFLAIGAPNNDGGGSQAGHVRVYSIDQTAPTITNTILGPDNLSISVTFSETVYNSNSASGALEASDFSLSMSGGDASLGSNTPTNITSSGDTYKLGINLSGTPDGNETITIVPVDNGVYDSAANEASTNQSNNSLKLHVIAAAPTSSGWQTGTIANQGTPYDIDADNLSPNAVSSQYGRNPEIVTVPTSTGFDVAWRDQNSNKIIITQHTLSNGVYQESRHLSLSSLGLLCGFTKDDAGNFYVITALDDNVTTSVQPTYDRYGILRLNKIGSDGTLTYWKEVIVDTVSALPIFDPMVWGTGRLVYGGNKLHFSFSHSTQYDAALSQRHQAHRQFQFNPSSGVLEKDWTGISHSFNQRLIYDGQNFIGIALGDVKRGINISSAFNTRNYDLGGGSYRILSWVVAFAIKGGSETTSSGGYQNTFTRLGDIVKSTNGYPIVFATEKSTTYTSSDDRAILDARNLGFVHVKNDFLNQVSSSNNFDVTITDASTNSNVASPYNVTINYSGSTTGTNRGVVWLTNYTDLNTENVEKPKLVSLGNGNFLALWEKWGITTTGNNYFSTSDYVETYAMVIDEYGRVIESARSLGQIRLQRDDDAFVHNGKAFWVRGDQNPSKLIVYSVDKDLNFKNESSPIILSAAISSDNSTLTVTMSEAVVNAASNGSALEASDFSLSISGGTMTLSSSTPSSISISGTEITLGVPKSGTADGNETITVTPIVNSIYDSEGNTASTTQSNNTASLNDITAPSFVTDYPTTSNVAGTSFNLKLKINEGGKGYYVVLADNATAPTAAEVKAGTGSSAARAVKSGNSSLTADTEVSIGVTDLSSETAYDIYVVAEDDENTPNVQSPVSKLEITTTDITAPSFATDYPTTSNVAGTSFDLKLMINGGGKGYCVVLTDESTAPTSAEIKAGTGSGGATAIKSGSVDLTADTEANISITELASETAYDVYVVAEDASSNIQTSPTQVDVTTSDVTAPAVPTGLTPTAGDAQVTLTWKENTESDVAKYIIYGSTASAPTAKVDSTTGVADTSKTLTGLTNSTPYYYRLKAVDNLNNESDYSSEVSSTPIQPNRAPVATAQTVTTNEDTEVTITLSGTDPDSDALTYSIVTLPANGGLFQTDDGTNKSTAISSSELPASVSNSEHKVIYSPNENGSGDGHGNFTFKVNDRKDDSETATVTVNVTAVNDPPTSFSMVSPANDTNIDINDGNYSDSLTFDWTASSDVEGESITYKIFFTDGLSSFSQSGLSADKISIARSDIYLIMDQSNLSHWTEPSEISGSWKVSAYDATDSTVADNASFSLTIKENVLLVDARYAIPDVFALHPNYPNPFNPTTTILYDLPEAATVHLVIYDILGKQIKTLLNQSQDAGNRIAMWDGTDDLGRQVSAGVYLYQIQAGGFNQTRKMLFLK